MWGPDTAPNDTAIFETGKHVVGVGILIAARKAPPEIDITPEKYATLNAQLKALIDARQATANTLGKLNYDDA
ncbi:hypothetical protein [uncultured Martelella sp.]|uniref:hypothetical protein n=1 Tax=uncultured Martelella sp. TaxID=392331 RepID=UPI0029C74FC9|nr:hypothetical protein [uncultured Martelella sp.]